MKTILIAVYKDTISRKNIADNNISYVKVTRDFAKNYWEERQSEYYTTFDEFLDNYTCDDTVDFYKYAKEHDAIIEIKNIWFERRDKLLWSVI